MQIIMNSRSKKYHFVINLLCNLLLYYQKGIDSLLYLCTLSKRHLRSLVICGSSNDKRDFYEEQYAEDLDPNSFQIYSGSHRNNKYAISIIKGCFLHEGIII